MNTWANIPDRVKNWGGAFLTLVAVSGVLFAWGSLLQTDAEAQEHINDFHSYQQQQLKSDKNERVDRIELQTNDIDFRLLSDNLSEKEREYLKNQRQDLKDKQKCIQDDTC